MLSNDTLRDLADRHGTPLLVLERGALAERLRLFRACLPGVEPHYAIKACPHPEVVRTLYAAGANFDIATSGEITLARSCGIPPALVIHTHPIKRDVDIRAALRFGCTTFVVDNAQEIEKFSRYRERVGLLLRVRTENPHTRVDLSRKFGCPAEQVMDLVRYAAARGVHIKGLSFHIGSQTGDPTPHADAIRTLGRTLDACRGVTDARLTTLDIGGGFPVLEGAESADPLPAYCAPLREALGELPPRIKVIAEPGRTLVAPAMTSVNSVVGVALRNGQPWYYLDDGVYGAFSGKVFDHGHFLLSPLEQAALGARPVHTSVVAGPTCDSIDVVNDRAELPELALGERLVTRNIGAYSWATATEFNSIPKPQVLVVD